MKKITKLLSDCHQSVSIKQRSVFERIYSPDEFNLRESERYEWWKTHDLFSAKQEVDYATLFPPPNITGVLHIGHAFTLSIEDAMIRHKRMTGRHVAYIPGTDHAGIATQAVITRNLDDWFAEIATHESLQNKPTSPEIVQIIDKLSEIDSNTGNKSTYGKYKKGLASLLSHDELRSLGRLWKTEFSEKIRNQMEIMGASLDWKRLYHTMDPKHSELVKLSFIKLYLDGLLYRSDRLAFFSHALKSTISDLEVDYKSIARKTAHVLSNNEDSKEVNSVVLGLMHTFKYPLQYIGEHNETTEQYLAVSTTRIETMLGDEAIAVHPEDSRFSHLFSDLDATSNVSSIYKAIHPLISDKQLLIIRDPRVDIGLGTGAVKITPCADPLDYDIAKSHNLALTNMLTIEGKFNDAIIATSNLALDKGTSRFAARVQILAKLQKMGLLISTEEKEMKVPICSRSGDIVEYRVVPQWYISTKGLAHNVNNELENGHFEISPTSYITEWNKYMLNIKDWCLSRQLWWGHQIPAYMLLVLKSDVNDVIPKLTINPQNEYSTKPALEEYIMDSRKYLIVDWIIARSLAEAESLSSKKYSPDILTKMTIKQDPDVLDTWFSSGLIPISTTDEYTKTIHKLNYEINNLLTVAPTEHTSTHLNESITDDICEPKYPLDVLETGSDILFFWVARMGMLCTELTGKTPYKKVILHPMIKDSQGRKMSKSLGNVMDPLDYIYGTTQEKMIERITNAKGLSQKERNLSINNIKRDFKDGIKIIGPDILRLSLCDRFSLSQPTPLSIVLENHKNDTINTISTLGSKHGTCLQSSTFGNDNIIKATKFIIKYKNMYRFFTTYWQDLGYDLPANKSPKSTIELLSMPTISYADVYIVHRLHATIAFVNNCIKKHCFKEATREIASFVKKDICDYYISYLSAERKQYQLYNNCDTDLASVHVIHTLIDTLNRLLHPFVPFITEDINMHLAMLADIECNHVNASIMTKSYPETSYLKEFLHDNTAINNFHLIKYQDITTKADHFTFVTTVFDSVNQLKTLCNIKLRAPLKMTIDLTINDFNNHLYTSTLLPTKETLMLFLNAHELDFVLTTAPVNEKDHRNEFEITQSDYFTIQTSISPTAQVTIYIDKNSNINLNIVKLKDYLYSQSKLVSNKIINTSHKLSKFKESSDDKARYELIREIELLNYQSKMISNCLKSF